MSYNVLVVDDSEVIRAVVKKVIGMSGVAVGEIHEATNGREALDILAAQWIDIVFADINMPGMNGMELVARMAEDPNLSRTPVVIISSERNQARIDELQQHGVRAYMKKPFRPEDFRDVIQRLLETEGG